VPPSFKNVYSNLEKFESVPKDFNKTIHKVVINHLKTEEKIILYFPNLVINNLIVITNTSLFKLILGEAKKLVSFFNDRDLIKHSEESINSFWIYIRYDYPMIAKKAFKILLHFSTFFFT